MTENNIKVNSLNTLITPRAFSFVEIMIAVAILGATLIPLITIINKTLTKTHSMNYEITAELIGKNILEQIVKNVDFEKVNDKLTVGSGGGFDVKLSIADEGEIIKTEFDGNKSGSIIKAAGAEFKWELEIIDIRAGELPLSFWFIDNSEGGEPWPARQKGTKADGLKKAVTFNGDTFKANNYTINKELVILKTLKLRIRWQLAGDTNNFSDQRNSFILVTRKAQLDNNVRFKKKKDDK